MGRDPAEHSQPDNVETLILDHGSAVLLNHPRPQGGSLPRPRTLYDAFLWYAYEQGLLQGIRGHLGEEEIGRAYRIRLRTRKQNKVVAHWAERIQAGTVTVNGRIVVEFATNGRKDTPRDGNPA